MGRMTALGKRRRTVRAENSPRRLRFAEPSRPQNNRRALGWTIYDVSILLGHADVKTTERYLGVADRRSGCMVVRRPLALVKS